jgi:hypothetical protein
MVDDFVDLILYMNKSGSVSSFLTLLSIFTLDSIFFFFTGNGLGAVLLLFLALFSVLVEGAAGTDASVVVSLSIT